MGKFIEVKEENNKKVLEFLFDDFFYVGGNFSESFPHNDFETDRTGLEIGDKIRIYNEYSDSTFVITLMYCDKTREYYWHVEINNALDSRICEIPFVCNKEEFFQIDRIVSIHQGSNREEVRFNIIFDMIFPDQKESQE